MSYHFPITLLPIIEYKGLRLTVAWLGFVYFRNKRTQIKIIATPWSTKFYTPIYGWDKL